ncbi:MAG TPA: AraC family transcriptional regulator [Steroidobacteraceae bacterium]
MTGSGSLASIDLMLRGGACMLLLIVGLLLIRDYGRTTAGRLGALFATGAAAHALWNAAALPRPFGIFGAVLVALSAGNSLVFWLFARALFDDGFRARWWHTALWCLIAGAGILCGFVLHPAGVPWLSQALAVQSVLFALLAGAQTLASWRADLVEPRRRLRLFIVVTAAAYTVVTAASGVLGAGAAPLAAAVAEAAVLLCLAAVVAYSLLRISGNDLLVAAPLRESAAVAENATPPLEPAELESVAALKRVMMVERLYRRDGLTIGRLAELQDVPEYKLRRLINQGLGYRNFTQFLNHYRLADAKAALADPSQPGKSILNIALDAGFNSLGPFNRAFKAENGVTPGEYRRARVGAAMAAGEPQRIQ